MIHILVKLSVKNFELFEAFEKQAAVIMDKYDGHILSAFETVREPDGSGEEVHILEFPNHEAFNQYRSDTDLAELASLREQAIANTEVQISLCLKDYG